VPLGAPLATRSAGPTMSESREDGTQELAKTCLDVLAADGATGYEGGKPRQPGPRTQSSEDRHRGSQAGRMSAESPGGGAQPAARFFTCTAKEGR
jgi:hypothetical protein